MASAVAAFHHRVLPAFLNRQHHDVRPGHRGVRNDSSDLDLCASDDRSLIDGDLLHSLITPHKKHLCGPSRLMLDFYIS